MRRGCPLHRSTASRRRVHPTRGWRGRRPRRPLVRQAPRREISLPVFALIVVLTVLQSFTRGSAYLIANIAVTVLYYSISLSLKSRASGQWSFGQMTVTLNCGLLSPRAPLKRAGWIVVSYLLLGLPLLYILFSPKRQAFHDFMADTVVILRKRN
jgi:uncharacterized RDD family membrane protein YckC